jgi:hypothetical protein
MAIEQQVTRRPAGVHPDGSPRWDVTFESRPRPPESVPEWVGQRVAALGMARTYPAGRVAVQLLEADGGAAVRAAVAAGRDLDDHQRWAVLQTLEKCLEVARGGYAPATGLMAERISAWTAKYGCEQPQPRAA